MFANPLLSVAILAALGLMFLIMRLKHGGPLLAPYRHIDNWWTWLKAITFGFRSWVASAVTGILIAFPDIAVAILPVDLSWAIGERYATTLTGMLTAYLAVNRAWSTKPPGEAA